MKLLSPKYYFIFALIFLSVLILASVSPLLQPVPGRDSGLFLYFGERILDGQILYHDIWDHKGPLIYYLNAAGLALGLDSYWGVWLIEVLFLSLSAILGYQVMLQAYGVLPAIFGTVAWMVSMPVVLESGNFTEEYSLLINFLSIYLFWLSMATNRMTRLYNIIIGLCLAINILLRPNNIGLQLAIILFYIVTAITSKDIKAFLPTLYIGLGAFVGVFISLLFFYNIGALKDLIDSVFRYNISYIFQSDSQFRFKEELSPLRFITAGFIGFHLTVPASIFAALSWFIFLFRSISKSVDSYNKHLTQMVIIAFPLEYFLANVSNRNYKHYFLTWLPVLGILTGLFVYYI